MSTAREAKQTAKFARKTRIFSTFLLLPRYGNIRPVQVSYLFSITLLQSQSIQKDQKGDGQNRVFSPMLFPFSHALSLILSSSSLLIQPSPPPHPFCLALTLFLFSIFLVRRQQPRFIVVWFNDTLLRVGVKVRNRSITSADEAMSSLTLSFLLALFTKTEATLFYGFLGWLACPTPNCSFVRLFVRFMKEVSGRGANGSAELVLTSPTTSNPMLSFSCLLMFIVSLQFLLLTKASTVS